LTFSLVVDPDAFDLPACLWPQVALTAALSVLEGVSQVVPGSPVGLRWPNDVHLGGKKICGVLVEPVVIEQSRLAGHGSKARIGKADSKRARRAQRGATSTKREESALRIPNSTATQSPTRLVIGVGVNLNNSLRNAPPEVQRTGTSLADRTGDRYDPTATLLEILDQLKQGLDWLAVGDFRLSEAWQKHCILRGRIVTIDAGPNVVTGRCLGIDRRGALQIETGDGVEALYGGAIRSAT
jgi:BirA family biotin operon repressor/biotin-[acetyl-CoA-carboxylase] ligase